MNNDSEPIDSQTHSTNINEGLVQESFLSAVLETQDDNESYEPSVSQMMEECDDLALDFTHSDTSGNSELAALLKESEVPLDVLMRGYAAAEEEREIAMDINNYENERVLRNNNKRAFNVNHVYDATKPDKKVIKIGPEHQVQIPSPFCPLPASSLPPSSEYDEVIFDPYCKAESTMDFFWEMLRQERPKIINCDELVWNLFKKHNGNIEAALSDFEEIERIEQINQMPITDWSQEELETLKEAIIKHRKKFKLIQELYLPHKPLKNIIQTYYSIKRTTMFIDICSKKYFNYRGDTDAIDALNIPYENGSTLGQATPLNDNFITDYSSLSPKINIMDDQESENISTIYE